MLKRIISAGLVLSLMIALIPSNAEAAGLIEGLKNYTEEVKVFDIAESVKGQLDKAYLAREINVSAKDIIEVKSLKKDLVGIDVASNLKEEIEYDYEVKKVVLRNNSRAQSLFEGASNVYVASVSANTKTDIGHTLSKDKKKMISTTLCWIDNKGPKNKLVYVKGGASSGAGAGTIYYGVSGMVRNQKTETFYQSTTKYYSVEGLSFFSKVTYKWGSKEELKVTVFNRIN